VGKTSTSLQFNPWVKNPKFIVENIGSSKKGSFSDKVFITYTLSDGTTSKPLEMDSLALEKENKDIKGKSKNDWVVVINEA